MYDVDYNPNAPLPDHQQEVEGDPDLYYQHHHDQPPAGPGLVLLEGEDEPQPSPPPIMDFHYNHLGQDLPPPPPPPVMFHHQPNWDDIPFPAMSDPSTFPGGTQEVMINLLNLPRCSASSFLTDQDTVFLPPHQPPFFRELFQSSPLLPVFGEEDDHHRDGFMGWEGPVVDPAFEGGGGGGVFEFARDMGCIVGKGRRGGRKVTKHFTTERERRVNMNGRFDALRSLVPNPSKTDRASTVADAIDYIKELLRSVDELKLLVEKKRRRNGRGGRSKRHKTEGDVKDDGECSRVKLLPEVDDQDAPSHGNGSVRTSWLQRKSKDLEVDVRVVDDEVTIKLVWRKKINCLLLYVSKALDELQLDLYHVAGGHIGDHCCFLFNTKIYEGSSVYASAIANKLIAVVDGQFAVTPPPTVSCY